MVSFGEYRVGLGMIAIIAAVAAGFWYAASDDYFQPETSAEDTSISTDTQAEPLVDATREQTGDNSDEATDSVSNRPLTTIPPTQEATATSQLPWTMVNQIISEFYSEKRQSMLLSNLDSTMTLNSSPEFAATGQVLIEENQASQELREADFHSDNDNTDFLSTDQMPEISDSPVRAEEPKEPEVNDEPAFDDDRAENEDTGPLADLLDAVVDDLESTDEFVSDVLQTSTDEVLEMDDENDEPDNRGPGNQNSGEGGEEKDDSDNHGEDDNEDRSGSNRGRG